MYGTPKWGAHQWGAISGVANGTMGNIAIYTTKHLQIQAFSFTKLQFVDKLIYHIPVLTYPTGKYSCPM